MRKYVLLLCCVFMVSGCDKHDPILPGVRTAIFDTGANQNILNIDVPNLPDAIPENNAPECKYTIDNTNTIRDGDRKIFVGFSAPNSMDIETHPICDNGYVYAGLNTGSVVKIAPSTRRIMWMADVYSESNMMGGAATVDIVAPLVINGGWLYVGGMGNAFCKINITSGSKKWCANVGTRRAFIVLSDVAYVVGLDDMLYAIRLSDGAIYWRSELKQGGTPKYENKQIIVRKQKFDAATGQEL
jgi:outer membrane protein assembly factor BamB